MCAARHIDDPGLFRQLREQLRVQNAARLMRQRQDADQHVALAEKGGQFALTGKAFDTRHILARTAPARHLKIKSP